MTRRNGATAVTHLLLQEIKLFFVLVVLFETPDNNKNNTASCVCVRIYM